MAADAHARVCTCGHTAHWHNAIVDGIVPDPFKPEHREGEGECEANGDCECKLFVEDKTDSYESLRHERDEALERLRKVTEVLA